MSNWWGNKLGAPAPRQDYAPQQQRSPQDYLAQQQQQQQAAPQQPQQYEPPDPGDPHGHQKGMWNWQGNPRGGLGETISTGNCPNCNSNKYFSRRDTGGVTTSNGVVYPSPECFECGYPRIQGSLGTPAAMGSGVEAARQPGSSAPGGSFN